MSQSVVVNGTKSEPADLQRGVTEGPVLEPILFTIYTSPTQAVARGTGMIASSSTFRPHLGRVITDLFRLLDAVYGIVRKH